MISCGSALAVPATVSDGSPIRVAFVGQDVYFRVCSLAQPAGGLQPTFVDFRRGARESVLLAALERLDPDVVVVFRREIIPRGLFGLLRAMTVGYFTEPLPRKRSVRHRDLEERMAALRQVDPGNFDRIVSFDPLIGSSAGRVLKGGAPCQSRSTTRSSWTCTSAGSRRDSCSWAGPRSTARRFSHRSSAVIGSSTSATACTARGDALPRERRRATQPPQPPLSDVREPRVPRTRGRSPGDLQPLSPDHGLRAGRDFLEADGADTFLSLVDELARDPPAFLDVQRAGREQAEQFRASRVYPPLIRDALEDVAEHGSPRQRH